MLNKNPTKDMEALKLLIKSVAKSNYSGKKSLAATLINSPLGQLVTIADEEKLYLLQCFDYFKLDIKLKQLMAIKKMSIEIGQTKPIQMLQMELEQYFNGQLKFFQTPIELIGTEFQLAVWKLLKQIPYGKSLSYGAVAKAIGKPNAVRAVGTAVGSNRFVIIIPCHRVINTTGKLGGFSCGLHRKRLLIAVECKPNDCN